MRCDDTNLKYRQWSQQATADRRLRLSPTAGASGFPNGPKAGCIEAVGRWANVDVLVQAPRTWADVTCELVARSADIETVLEHRTIGDIQSTFRPSAGTIISGTLFSVRGKVADSWAVRAYRTTVAHAEAKFRMECWGDGGAAYGDRSTRQLADLWARPNQHQRLAAPAGGTPVGVPLPAFAANPSGGRAALTRLEWTNNNPAAGPVPTLVLRRNPGAIDVAWYALPADGRLVVDFAPPLYNQPGETWDFQLGAGGGTNWVNMSAFYD
jgi:hypothetical protein